MDPKRCTEPELRSIIRYHRATIHKMVRNEGMPCIQEALLKNRYFDLSLVVPWLIERERRRQHPDTGALSLERECKRLIKAQAAREELDNAVKRDELI